MTQRRPSKPTEALPETPIVLIVDDDSSVREALGRLFRSVDLEPKLFASVAELMRHKFPDAPCCLVLDIRLPGVSGLDFQTQLVEANIHVPIIMMTGHGDIPMSVRAMKGGAVDFLTKPFRDQDILDAVAQAIERDRKRRDSDKALAELRGLFESLTPARAGEMPFGTPRKGSRFGQSRTPGSRVSRSQKSRMNSNARLRANVARILKTGWKARKIGFESEHKMRSLLPALWSKFGTGCSCAAPI